MGMRINTNVPSLTAQRSLGTVQQKQAKSMERLSTGSRIVRASDDAAGLAISEQMKADIKSTRQASRNANDGISMIQTAEGGLNEVSNILIRLRELSVQAASDTIGERARSFSDLEFQQLTQEIDRIAESTDFGGRALLNGQGDDVDIQIGIHNNPENDRLKYSPNETNAKAGSLGVEGIGVKTKVEAQENLAVVDEAIGRVNGHRANLGALQNRLQSTINNIGVKTENLERANSVIRDTDVASESAELVKANILQQATVAVLGQANNSATSAVRLLG